MGDLVLQGLLQTTTLYCLLFATFLTEREEETNKETTKDREEEEEGKKERIGDKPQLHCFSDCPSHKEWWN